MKKLAKKDLMENRIKRGMRELEILSHTHVRKRDSLEDYEVGGLCCTCMMYAYGSNFQAGHFDPASLCGLWLLHHPHNMHGQCGFKCNINKHGTQSMSTKYTLFMIDKYGRKYVDYLLSQRKRLENLPIPKIEFLETMISLYKKGIEQDIINYLESL